jgi:hypothetical protein
VFLAACFIFQIVLCPNYQKQIVKPFAGNNWYNPYADSDTEWQKAIFHAHSKAWGGITNGKGSPLNVHKTYDSLLFGVHSVSNYFSIDTHLQTTPKYVSAYEHGTGINRTHQLVLGSKAVVWNDFLLPQTFNNKQYILNKLAADTGNVIIINHPRLDGAYSKADMAYLKNYNCVEVLNPQATSFELYDAALSAGHPVFMVANDDNHDVSVKYNLGNFYTCIPAKASNQYSILQSLKNGNGYAVASNQRDTTFPLLLSAKITDNQYKITCDMVADSIQFIGQNGKIVQLQTGVATANYALQQSDTYIRVMAVFPNGQQIFLNPIFRYETLKLAREPGLLMKNNALLSIVKIMMLLIIGSLLYLTCKKNKI